MKMALSCHADYRWICGTPLKVNETDFEWEKIKNHISGIWNSSDIGLDLGKLHNQIATMEHSRLDFTAAGTQTIFKVRQEHKILILFLLPWESYDRN